ncbi:hypothetical protein PJM52_29485, partial [Mycobacterium kansasii]
AIIKASESVKVECPVSPHSIVDNVIEDLANRKDVSVEDIEQLVMNSLKGINFDIYKSYYNYKVERDKKRNSKARKTFRSIV